MLDRLFYRPLLEQVAANSNSSSGMAGGPGSSSYGSSSAVSGSGIPGSSATGPGGYGSGVSGGSTAQLTSQVTDI